MIVYIETNFVLEMALEQEEWESCQTLLALSAANAISLVAPVYALVEPIETLVRRDKSRKELAERVRSELRQLGRSEPYRQDMSSHQALVQLLIKSGDDEIQRYTETRTKLVQLATIIPLDSEIMANVPAVQEAHGLSQQDALILASVLRHRQDSGGQISCFVTRNARDFSGPDIGALLDSMGCKLLFKFADAVSYASQLDQQGGPFAASRLV